MPNRRARGSRPRAALLAMSCTAALLVACGDSPADPVQVTFDAPSATWQLSVDREQTRNVRDAVSIAAALIALCGLKAPSAVCGEISVSLDVSVVFIARVYENGNCLGLRIALRPVPATTPAEIPAGTRNCLAPS